MPTLRATEARRGGTRAVSPKEVILELGQVRQPKRGNTLHRNRSKSMDTEWGVNGDQRG